MTCPGVTQGPGGRADEPGLRQHGFLPPGSHSSASFVLSAGCFFGDEVRGGGDSCAPSDVDASSEAERPGPEQAVPADPLESPRSSRGSSASGPGTSKTTEHAEEGASPADQTPRPEPPPRPASTPAELPWTSIDLKEPRKAAGHSAADFPETTSLSSLGMLPLGLEEPYCADDHPLWAWVSGGGCAVEPHAALKWFTVQPGKGGHPGKGRRHCPVLGRLCPASKTSAPPPSCPRLGGHSGPDSGDIGANDAGRARGYFIEIAAP